MKQVGVNFRDDLYVTDYIMNMFSYDTFENEVKYEWAKSDKKEIKISNYVSIYNSYNEAWKASKDKLTVTENKTLTNKMLCEDNNYAYGSEIEYILYGGRRAGNITKAYASIYMIRFALDATPVFLRYWSGQSTEARITKIIAEAVAAATYGIIPAPLVKIAICLGATAIEAATDLVYLKAGMKVKLIKSSDEISTKFPEITEEDVASVEFAKEDSVPADDSKDDILSFQYSDYLTLFLMLGLMSDNNADKIYLRIADVVQTNMGKITNKLEGDNQYLLSNAQVYFRISVDVKVKPLMLGLPINTSHGEIIDISSWNTFKVSLTGGY